MIQSPLAPGHTEYQSTQSSSTSDFLLIMCAQIWESHSRFCVWGCCSPYAPCFEFSRTASPRWLRTTGCEANRRLALSPTRFRRRREMHNKIVKSTWYDRRAVSRQTGKRWNNNKRWSEAGRDAPCRCAKWGTSH